MGWVHFWEWSVSDFIIISALIIDEQCEYNSNKKSRKEKNIVKNIEYDNFYKECDTS